LRFFLKEWDFSASNSAGTMAGIVRPINGLSPYSGDIYTFLAEGESLNSRAAKEQVIEGRIKSGIYPGK
jgi:hypothetical protein